MRNFNVGPWAGATIRALTRKPAAPTNATDVSEKGLEFIGRFEGFRDMPYNDAAVPPNATIGYGHMIHRGPVTVNDRIRYKKGITQANALTLLRADAALAVYAVRRYCKVPLTQPQFDALVSFTFNCGAGAFE